MLQTPGRNGNKREMEIIGDKGDTSPSGPKGDTGDQGLWRITGIYIPSYNAWQLYIHITIGDPGYPRPVGERGQKVSMLV